MKKLYIICFLILGILFSTAYYTSYKMTLDSTKTPENTEEIVLPEPLPDMEANYLPELSISEKTEFTVEKYLLKDKTITRETSGIPKEFIGFTRKNMIEYIQNYMENLPREEQEAGLVSCELTSFSDDKVVLRKTYYFNESDYEYYLGVQMGRVVVYHTKDDSLYAYTEIKFGNLPEELKREILAGKYITSAEELYRFLESYSS